jgi:hypothetical protein
MTFAQFRRLQLRELNEFLADSISANYGNLAKASRSLRMHPFVLKRHVKRYGLVSGYGSRPPIRGDATKCRVAA